MIEPAIRKMMAEDIIKCEKQGIKGSHQLFRELKARYITLDSDFMSGITVSAKAIVAEMDYTKELAQIKQKLEMYLMLDRIPIKDNENVQINNTYNYNNCKFTNKGNYGDNNTQSKDKQINENGTKTTNWFKFGIKGDN